MGTTRDWPTEHSEPVGLAVLLPGKNYQANMALMKFAGLAAAQRGWRVREVSWQVPDLEGERLIEWAENELEAAVGHFDGRVLVIGKSMASLAAGYAGRAGFEGMWLTPVLTNPTVASTLSEYPRECFLLGGTADPLWSHEVAVTVNKSFAEIDGGDHSLCVKDDAIRTAEMHLKATRAMSAWLDNFS